MTLDSDLCLGSTMLTSLCGLLQGRPAVLDQHGSSHLPHFGHGQLSHSALAEMENVINSSVIILPGFIPAQLALSTRIQKHSLRAPFSRLNFSSES